jgi:hypothetical protein
MTSRGMSFANEPCGMSGACRYVRAREEVYFLTCDIATPHVDAMHVLRGRGNPLRLKRCGGHVLS